MSLINICIATPCYGGQVFMSYVNCLMSTINMTVKNKISVTLIDVTNESLVQRARNVLVAKFLAKKSCTHLLFIDADISWRPDDLLEMIKADKDVIGGIYPKKAYKWSNFRAEQVIGEINKLNEEDCKDDSKYEKLVIPMLLDYVVRVDGNLTSLKPVNEEDCVKEVNYVGTGFMLIKREVIEKMCEYYKKTKFSFSKNEFSSFDNDEFLFALFDCEVVNEEYLSEDYLFCKRWKEMGGKIHAYTKTKLKHTGTHTFNGDFFNRVSNLKL